MGYRIPAINIFMATMLFLFGRFYSLPVEPDISWTKIADDASTGVSMSPDGSLIAHSVYEDGSFEVVNWRTGETLWQSNGRWSQSHWSPDGQWIAALPGNVVLFNASTGERMTQVEKTFEDTGIALGLVNGITDHGYTDLRWSADSQQLAAMTHGYIVIYDFSLGRVTDIIDVVIVQTPDLHNYLSWFDWSPDGSKFAAFHYRRESGAEVFPLDIVLGFWTEEGRWLSDYEDAQSECLPRGKELFRGFERPIGNALAWAPDNQGIAVSAGPVTVCWLQPDGTLSVNNVYPYAAEQLHWSADQRWLFGVYSNCSLLIADTSDNYSTQMRDFQADESCITQSASWSQDGKYVVIGTTSGLWVGEIGES